MRHEKVLRNSRATAAHIIARWLQTGYFLDRLIPPETADRAFVVEVVYGIVKQKRMLEWVLARCVNRKPDAQVLPYLLVGLFQVLVMDRTADYAAIHETVEAVRANGMDYATGFVNGVLRRAQREREAIEKERAKQPLGICESHPDILVERWIRQFGEANARRLCLHNNERPHVILRLNRQKTDWTAFSSLAQKAGVDAQPHPFRPDDFVTLPRGVRIPETPGYEEGLFSVQDPSTAQAVELLAPEPGEDVLDACAAPGGKTILIAERMAGKGRIVAMDVKENRLARLEENINRMRLETVEIVRGDATRTDSLRKSFGARRFDRILLDVPCANTGVLRRRPDARWRFSEDRLGELTRLQRSMLDATSGFLKPGGTLVYSTCSLEPEENEALVKAWLADNRGFEMIRNVSLFPPESETDGIHAAAIGQAQNKSAPSQARGAEETAES